MATAVDVDGDVTLGWAHLIGGERLVPDGEELTKGERSEPLDRRFDVDDAVRGMGMDPIRAVIGADLVEVAFREVLDQPGLVNAVLLPWAALCRAG